MKRAPASANAKAVEPNDTRMTATWTHLMNVRSFAKRSLDAGPLAAGTKQVRARRAASGSWKRYANEPRVQLVVLRKLAENGRAVATRGVATRLFAPRRRVQAMGSRALPDVLFWKILEFWRTDRDP